MKNMVDEKFELAAVVFRLAGHSEYSDLELDYQKEVAETFAKYANHEAVEYAKGLPLGYDAVFKFSVHIEKKDGKFIFIEDIRSLFDGRWNEESADRFLELYNKFYIDTNYEEFFNSHIELFEQSTQKFIDEVYGKIDLEWFGKYVDPSNLRCIYSLSSGNYGATVNDKIIYSLIYKNGSAIVHEWCHSFANPLADKWYNENPEFRKWCDESVNSEKMPYYSHGVAMAREYVTRAYTLLYLIRQYLSKERDFNFKDSFKYIENVYNMILELE